MKKLLLILAAAFCVSCASTEDSLNFAIDYDAARELHKPILGTNNEFISTYYTPNSRQYKEVFEGSGCVSFRYPAGTGANQLNLLTGRSQTWPNSPQRRIDGMNSSNESIERTKGKNGFDYRDMTDFVKECKPTLTYVMNVSSLSADENRQILEKIKAEGVEVTHIEMGNEVYFSTYDTSFSDVEDYITRVKVHSDEARKVFPNVKIAYVVFPDYYTREVFLEGPAETGTRLESWYRALMDNKDYDALAIHLYSATGMDEKTPKGDYVSYLDGYTSTTSHADCRTNMTFERLAKDFPGVETWITEYHVGGFSTNLRAYRLRYSYVGAIFCANFMFKLFEQPNVTLSSWHNMCQWLDAKPEKGEKFTDETPYSHEFANYYAFQMFKEPVHNGNCFIPVDVLNAQTYAGVGEFTGDYSEVDAGVFYNDETKEGYMMLFNKFDTQYSLNIKNLERSLDAKFQACKELSPSKTLPLEQALEDENKVSIEENLQPLNGALQIAPYSIYQIKFSRN